jgi:preprotein translocase subunit SecA
LAFAQFSFQQPDFAELPEMPDFITHHIDPFTGDDDTADIDAATGNVLSRLPPLQAPRPEMPQADFAGDVAVEDMPPVSRNAPCPCGSGRKFKHCHGQLG